MFKIFKNIDRKNYRPILGGLDIFKFIGPGLLVTVGFIDPGNWASNLAAGAEYGYALLWMVTLSTVMLIMLQHNVAHLGIATGLCFRRLQPFILSHHTPNFYYRRPCWHPFLLLWPKFWVVPSLCTCYSVFLFEPEH